MSNKKVLLRERKRHTAPHNRPGPDRRGERGVPCPGMSWRGEGGIPRLGLAWLGGRGTPVLAGGGRNTPPWPGLAWGRGTPVLAKEEGGGTGYGTPLLLFPSLCGRTDTCENITFSHPSEYGR